MYISLELLTEIVTSHFHLGIQTLGHSPSGIPKDSSRFSTQMYIHYSRNLPDRSHVSIIMVTAMMTLILMSRRVNMGVVLVN